MRTGKVFVGKKNAAQQHVRRNIVWGQPHNVPGTLFGQLQLALGDVVFRGDTQSVDHVGGDGQCRQQLSLGPVCLALLQVGSAQEVVCLS